VSYRKNEAGTFSPQVSSQSAARPCGGSGTHDEGRTAEQTVDQVRGDCPLAPLLISGAEKTVENRVERADKDRLDKETDDRAHGEENQKGNRNETQIQSVKALHGANSVGAAPADEDRWGERRPEHDPGGDRPPDENDPGFLRLHVRSGDSRVLSLFGGANEAPAFLNRCGRWLARVESASTVAIAPEEKVLAAFQEVPPRFQDQPMKRDWLGLFRPSFHGSSSC
jgi:hypothetical protein